MSRKEEMDELEDYSAEIHNKIIIHIDMDYFYAQVEEIRDPTLRSKPIGIQQKSMLVTSNLPAREFGVKKLMSIAEAKKLCPHIVLVCGEDLTNYRQMSAKIFEIVQKYTPLVEKLGLDENYLDVTDVINQRLSKNFNEKILEVEGNIYPNDRKLDECTCGCAKRLAIGTHIAKEIRDELYKVLGITCCAGIAYNKLLAKLVGSMNKPNNQTVLLSTVAARFMRELGALQKVTGIGHKTEQLLNESNIKSVTDLQNCDFNIIKKKFGFESAQRLKELSFGRDNNPLRPSGKPKTIGLEDSCRPISVRKDIEDKFRLLLMRLVNQVSEDGRIPVTVKIMLRKFDAKKKTSHRETKQANILPSLFKQLHDGQIMLAEGAQEKLLKIIMRLFERIVDMAKPFDITLLGLSFSKFQERKLGSSSIANFLIKKTDLEVQSITSLKSDGAISSHESSDDNTTSPIPMSIDIESFSDVSDFSEPEIEPSPKKTRLGLLIAKRRCLASNDINDIASPSKLRVAELRLNSRDSEKDGMCPTATTTTTTIPLAICTKSQTNKTIISSLDTSVKTVNESDIRNGHITNEDINISDVTISSTSGKTTITGNLANIPCPSGVDPNVFKELPADVQNELIASWRSSLTAKTNSNHTSGGTGGSTLHRYFIKNK